MRLYKYSPNTQIRIITKKEEEKWSSYLSPSFTPRILSRNKLTTSALFTTTTKNINIRRVAETQMASVRKRNIQVDTIVYGTYNVGTWSFHLFVLFQLLIQLLQVQSRLKIPKQPEQDSGYTPKSKIFAPS